MRERMGTGAASAAVERRAVRVRKCFKPVVMSASQEVADVVLPSLVLTQVMYSSPCIGAPFKMFRKLVSRWYSIATLPLRVGGMLGRMFGYSTA
ncbi:hypothetical protein CTI14_03875 [Methylobacterium radiotolerans]|nr:hypothetical protein CTI14_03875 [Methylobacterium radiotolerans]